MCIASFDDLTGLGLLLGVPVTVVFWGGLVVPFVAGGVVARFWPLVRDRVFGALNWATNKKDQFWHKDEQKGVCMRGVCWLEA